MKRAYLLITILITTPFLHADPNEQAQRFLKIEGADPKFRIAEPETWKKADLPAGLLELLKGYDWGASDASLPATFDGFAMDLNSDGKKEYFVKTIYGGSGGPAFVILSQINERWQAILNFQGVFGVIPNKTEWPKIVATSKGGGGTFTKCHFEFDSGRYHEILREQYEAGVVTATKIPKE